MSRFLQLVASVFIIYDDSCVRIAGEDTNTPLPVGELGSHETADTPSLHRRRLGGIRGSVVNAYIDPKTVESKISLTGPASVTSKDVKEKRNNEKMATTTVVVAGTGTKAKERANDGDDDTMMMADMVREQFNQCPFNYTAFWEHALHFAQSSSINEEPSTHHSPCPKVYVYELPEELTDVSSHQINDVNWVFGEKSQTEGNFSVRHPKMRPYTTAQFAFPVMMEHRLRHSKECRTLNPDEADLFFVPILTAPKTTKMLSKSCKILSNNTMWTNKTKLHSILPHLNTKNACRHFFAVGVSRELFLCCFFAFILYVQENLQQLIAPHSNRKVFDQLDDVDIGSRIQYQSYSLLFDSHTTTSTIPKLIKLVNMFVNLSTQRSTRT